MSGSRKGERRGGAKPRIVRKPTVDKPKFGGNTGRKKGAKNKPKGWHADPGAIAILERHIPVATKEKELEMYFTVTGKRQRLPKEVMLDAMRYFEETAIDWGQVVQANMMQAAVAKDPAEVQLLETAIAAAEARLREYVTMAVDVAYKAAPYVHPRLAALITNPGADQSPLNAISELFKELDEAGRPARYIDHDPGEVAK